MPPALAGQTFDLVCFLESIYYLADLREAFDLLRRVLRPGGGLYIKAHVPTSIFYWKNKNYFSRYGHSASGIPTLKAMTKILLREGYQIPKTGYFQFNVLDDLNFPGAHSFLGGIIGCRILSPIVSCMGKADRMFIMARRL
jgi:SAM-dependent methyltransferase